MKPHDSVLVIITYLPTAKNIGHVRNVKPAIGFGKT